MTTNNNNVTSDYILTANINDVLNLLKSKPVLRNPSSQLYKVLVERLQKEGLTINEVLNQNSK